MGRFLLFICLISGLSLFSQNIQVSAVEQHLTGSDLWIEYVTEIEVENTSDIMIDISVSKEYINVVNGSSNYFCWVACYLPNTFTSPSPITFAAGELNTTSFAVHYNPNGNVGLSAIRYCAFDQNNPVDSACTIVYYDVSGTNNIEEEFRASFSNFHPNPSSLMTELSYNILPGQHCEVVVLDILGNMVKKHQLSREEGELKFTLTDLKAGLYFANIMVDGQLHEIKRLIVSE